jgi:quinol monooxygenase YgiN
MRFLCSRDTRPWRRSVGSIAIACYKPRPGCADALLDLVRDHLPPLRAQKLVTDRAPITMRTADGTIIEIFEWISREAIESAHKNPVVLDLWKRFEAVCWYETPANITEFQNMFSHFEPVN